MAITCYPECINAVILAIFKIIKLINAIVGKKNTPWVSLLLIADLKYLGLLHFSFWC